MSWFRYSWLVLCGAIGLTWFVPTKAQFSFPTPPALLAPGSAAPDSPLPTRPQGDIRNLSGTDLPIGGGTQTSDQENGCLHIAIRFFEPGTQAPAQARLKDRLIECVESAAPPKAQDSAGAELIAELSTFALNETICMGLARRYFVAPPELTHGYQNMLKQCIDTHSS